MPIYPVALGGNVTNCNTPEEAIGMYLAHAETYGCDRAWAEGYIATSYGWCISGWQLAAAVLGVLTFDADGNAVRPADPAGEERATGFWRGVAGFADRVTTSAERTRNQDRILQDGRDAADSL